MSKCCKKVAQILCTTFVCERLFHALAVLDDDIDTLVCANVANADADVESASVACGGFRWSINTPIKVARVVMPERGLRSGRQDDPIEVDAG